MKGGTCNSPRYGPTINTNSTLLGSGTLLNISSICSSDVFPATLTSGLGLLQVWGRIRVAQPAMGIKIFSVSLIIQLYRVKYAGHDTSIAFPDVARRTMQREHRAPAELTNAPEPDATYRTLRAVLLPLLKD